MAVILEQSVVSAVMEFVSAVGVHTILYGLMVITIIYLFMKRSYKPIAQEPVVLSPNEKREILSHWKPVPLVPPMKDLHKLNIETIPVIERNENQGTVAVINGKSYHNFSSYNFLGFAQNETVIDKAEATLSKYGCGACGPRGFYGTLDVHLEFEKKAAEFWKVEDCILYSSGFACTASVIPAFAIRNDIILCDEGAKHSIQIGNGLARSRVTYFRHNDMKHVEELMKKSKENEERLGFHLMHRRFVIVETLYQNYGDVTPLPELIQLAKKYQFRIVIDESCAVGVLGATGKGAMEHFGINLNEVDIMICDLGFSLASIGGISFGKKHVVDFQRLNGLGYCFSAANPPYLVAASTETFRLLDKDSSSVNVLRENVASVRSLLSEALPAGTLNVGGCGLSPIIPLTLADAHATGDRYQDNVILQKIIDHCFEQGILLSRSKYTEEQLNLPKPSINFLVMAHHTPEQLQAVARALGEGTAQVLGR